MAAERSLLEVRTTALVLTVRLRDPSGGRPVRDDLSVSVAETAATPVPKPGAEFLVLRGDARPPVPSGPITVRVDGGDRYLDEERTVTPADVDRLLSIDLTPPTA